MSKLNIFLNRLKDWFDDFLAYLLSLFGMMLSIYGKNFSDANELHIKINGFKILVAAILTLILVWKQEALEPIEGSFDKSRAGRKKRFALRMVGAFTNGVAWTTLIQYGP